MNLTELRLSCRHASVWVRLRGESLCGATFQLEGKLRVKILLELQRESRLRVGSHRRYNHCIEHVFPSIPAVGHFDDSVPRSRLRGQSEKNTDELPLFVRRRRDARSIPSSTNHQLQWQTWTIRSEYQYLFGTKGINIAFGTYMNNIVH